MKDFAEKLHLSSREGQHDVILCISNGIFNVLSSEILAQQKVEERSQETIDETKEQAQDPVQKEVKEEHTDQMAAEETEKRVEY